MLWKNRCQLLFDEDILIQCLRLKEEVVASVANVRPVHAPQPAKPLPGWFKVNADRAVGGQRNMAAMGGVMRKRNEAGSSKHWQLFDFKRETLGGLSSIHGDLVFGRLKLVMPLWLKSRNCWINIGRCGFSELVEMPILLLINSLRPLEECLRVRIHFKKRTPF
ncbi:hypothetical protein V6N12_015336 [Hibiscus sabdariffa]|uniref:Uncharacterized protein n=1 Tax=Hibiscus sabdariffa TaxID=183260 RepID=A0ABR2DNA0_9ROSI